MAEVLCAGGGSGAFASGAGSGLGLDRRAASWNAGSAGASSVSGTGLAGMTSIGAAAGWCVAAAILEVASCGRRGNAAKPRTAATDSLVDKETIALDRSVSILAACDMLSLRTPNGLPEFADHERDLWSNCDASSRYLDRDGRLVSGEWSVVSR